MRLKTKPSVKSTKVQKDARDDEYEADNDEDDQSGSPQVNTPLLRKSARFRKDTEDNDMPTSKRRKSPSKIVTSTVLTYLLQGELRSKGHGKHRNTYTSLILSRTWW